MKLIFEMRRGKDRQAAAGWSNPFILVLCLPMSEVLFIPLTHCIRRVFKVEEICCFLRLLISEPKIKVKFSLSIFLNELHKQNTIMLSEAEQQHLITVPSEHSFTP